MSQEPKVLTKEIAEQLLEDPAGVDLSIFTKSEDAAAQALAGHGRPLELNGLTMLSDGAAQALAGHKGPLSLNGLKKLSDAAAQLLARREGWLSLRGLTDLADLPGPLALMRKLLGQRAPEDIGRGGLPVYSGESILVGGDDTYVSVCRGHYQEGKSKKVTIGGT